VGMVSLCGIGYMDQQANRTLPMSR
jgi:hypothetical protein